MPYWDICAVIFVAGGVCSKGSTWPAHEHYISKPINPRFVERRSICTKRAARAKMRTKSSHC